MPYIKNAIINPEYLFDVPKTQLDNMINSKNISEKINLLYRIFQKVGQSTFFELKKETCFNDIELCLALGNLIQAHKIYQKRIDGAVVYGIIN